MDVVVVVALELVVSMGVKVLFWSPSITFDPTTGVVEYVVVGTALAVLCFASVRFFETFFALLPPSKRRLYSLFVNVTVELSLDFFMAALTKTDLLIGFLDCLLNAIRRVADRRAPDQSGVCVRDHFILVRSNKDT